MILISAAIVAIWWAGWLLWPVDRTLKYEEEDQWKAKWARENWQQRLPHFVPLFLGVQLIFATVVVHPRLLVLHYPTVERLGLVFTVIGLAYATYARYYLAEYWTDKVEIKKDHMLVMDGPYGKIRNPIYLGLILAFGGAFLTAGTVAAFIGWILTIYAFCVKLRHEEDMLELEFREAWHYVEEKVPYRLVRGIW